MLGLKNCEEFSTVSSKKHFQSIAVDVFEGGDEVGGGGGDGGDEVGSDGGEADGDGGGEVSGGGAVGGEAGNGGDEVGGGVVMEVVKWVVMEMMGVVMEVWSGWWSRVK